MNPGTGYSKIPQALNIFMTEKPPGANLVNSVDSFEKKDISNYDTVFYLHHILNKYYWHTLDEVQYMLSNDKFIYISGKPSKYKKPKQQARSGSGIRRGRVSSYSHASSMSIEEEARMLGLSVNQLRDWSGG